MKITCPKNKRHKHFLTTVHEMHEWVIDNAGEFVEDKGCLQTVHGPTKGNLFICNTCKSEAIVE
jgi:tRNA1(Val) A37 N6-methylase TrmN6